MRHDSHSAMQVTSRFSKLFYVLARAVLLLRKGIELDSKDNSFRESGFIRFGKGFFVDENPDQMKELRCFLDAITKKHLADPLNWPASFDTPTYSYEFISENAFYNSKLGPRLRLTYSTNEFECWPSLAGTIIHSKKYRALLKEYFGTTTGVFKCYIEQAFSGGTEPEWHVDSISQVSRLMVLLSDVDSESAPMEYIAGSHRDDDSSFNHIKKHHLLHGESWTAHHCINAGDSLRRLTGAEGESYLFDARGVHRATLSNQKDRYVMVISFTPKTFFNWFFDLNRGKWPSGVRRL